MDEVLRSVSGLLLKAIPTFIIVVFLHFYLKRVYFRPMERLLAERRASTEGTRELAEQSLANASRKTADYEAALSAARAEIYREQEQFREKLREEHARALSEAKLSAEATLKEAHQQIAAELAAAQKTLDARTEALAGEIVRTILSGRVQ
ncbi:MAG: ATP synthase F0 subunit B [Bryobacteraceae bacterium]